MTKRPATIAGAAEAAALEDMATRPRRAETHFILDTQNSPVRGSNHRHRQFDRLGGLLFTVSRAD